MQFLIRARRLLGPPCIGIPHYPDRLIGEPLTAGAALYRGTALLRSPYWGSLTAVAALCRDTALLRPLIGEPLTAVAALYGDTALLRPPSWRTPDCHYIGIPHYPDRLIGEPLTVVAVLCRDTALLRPPYWGTPTTVIARCYVRFVTLWEPVHGGQDKDNCNAIERPSARGCGSMTVTTLHHARRQ